MRDVLGVLATAGRLFLRHWPALLTLAFLGAAVRSAALWLALEVSDVQAQLGQLFLLLAPLGYLIPIVGMLTLCRRSLPTLAVAGEAPAVAATEGRELRLVDVAVSVLVPFIAIYEIYGLLASDIERFRNLAAADEFNRFRFGPVDYDFQTRLGIYPLQIALVIVAVAFVLRWALGKLERASHIAALAFVGAFVELVYVSQLAGQSVVIQQRGTRWLEDRVAAQWLRSWYDAVADFLGPLAGAFRWLVDAAQSVAGSLDEVVVVPVGWLALGAVVLGYKVISDEAQEGQPPRGFLGSLKADVRERFRPLLQGVRLLFSSGLGPTLFLCLCFLLVVRVPALVLAVLREVVGPVPFDTSIAFGPEKLALGFALSMALTAPLLAASSDWLIRRRSAARSQGAATTPAPV